MNEMKDTSSISAVSLASQYLKKENCRFFSSDNDFLGAEINGTEYKRVILTRTLPLTMPDDFICISDVEKNELGIIEHILDYPEEQEELIRHELDLRYFCPCITSIKDVNEKFGNFYFDVLIGEYEKNFTVKNLSKSIRYHGSGFDIIDVDGNRYRITDFEKIPSRSRRKLEPYIY